MDVFKDLYQQLIIDHNQNPRNFRKLENASHSADGHNPLCGDEITVTLLEKKGTQWTVIITGIIVIIIAIIYFILNK